MGSLLLLPGLCIRQRGLDHDRAFQPFFLQLAGKGVTVQDIPLILLVIGVAAAGAVELGPALPALVLAKPVQD